MILAAMARDWDAPTGPEKSGGMQRPRILVEKEKKPARQHHSRSTTSPMVTRTILSGRLDPAWALASKSRRGPLTNFVRTGRAGGSCEATRSPLGGKSSRLRDQDDRRRFGVASNSCFM